MADMRRVPGRVDLTTAASHVDDLDAEGTLGLGGKVLGIRLLEQYLDPAVDPLSPDNVIAITPSLLVGLRHVRVRTGSAPSARARSPASGWRGTAAGTFARTLTRDRLGRPRRHAGRAGARCTCTSRSDGAQILPAADLWGKRHPDHRRRVLGALDKRSAVALHRSGRREPGEGSLGHARTGSHPGPGRPGSRLRQQEAEGRERHLSRAPEAGGSGAVRGEAPGGRQARFRGAFHPQLPAVRHPGDGRPGQRGGSLSHRLLRQRCRASPRDPRGRALEGVGTSRERHLPSLPCSAAASA